MTLEHKNIRVEFTECDTGWIRFTVSSGEESIVVLASHVFDPFPDYLKWLEAIVDGAVVAEFSIDEEGKDAYFKAELSKAGILRFTLKEGESVLLDVALAPKELVGAFYRSIVDWSESDAYRPGEWEFKTVGDRLVDYYEGNISEDGIVNLLSGMSATEVAVLFFSADPSYHVSFTNAQSTSENFSRFVDYCAAPPGAPAPDDLAKTPDKWKMPDGFDDWPRPWKAEHIKKCMEAQASGSWDGCDLRKLRSEKITRWLAGGS